LVDLGDHFYGIDPGTSSEATLEAKAVSRVEQPKSDGPKGLTAKISESLSGPDRASRMMAKSPSKGSRR
jgi:hypothetical protein